MKNYDFIEIADRCLSYLLELGPEGETDRLFLDSYKGNPNINEINDFLIDLDIEHSPGTDWLVDKWLMDMVGVKDIYDLPLSRNEVLYLRLRIECAGVLLPLLCGSDPQDPPNPRFALSISATSDREAVLWALTCFWKQVRLQFYKTYSAKFLEALLHKRPS